MKRGAVTGLPGHRPCAGSQNFSPREGAKVGRCQNTLWLAANRKGPEKSATVLKPVGPSSCCYYNMKLPSIP